MEAWRNELYNSFSHSVEGSTWKDHKYIAIVDGKYIYPEDVQNGNNSSSSNNVSQSVTASSNGNKTIKKTRKQKTANGAFVNTSDKGSVKSYKDLPKNPSIGDMYLLEDTKSYVYWDGQKWTPIDEKNKPVSYGGVGGGSGNTSVSASTIDRAREAMKKLSSSSSKGNIMSKSASSVANTSQVEKGKNAIRSLLDKVKSIFSKVTTAIKNTKVYKAGSSFVGRLRGR